MNIKESPQRSTKNSARNFCAVCASLWLLTACLTSLGCRRTATTSPSPAAPPTVASASSQQNQPVGGIAPAPQMKHFKGSIGSSLDLQMKLVRNGDQLTGSYFYQKVGTRIDVRGNVDKDGNLTLQEFDPSGKQTGLFKGIWKVDGADGLITLAGNWSKPPSEKGSDKKTAFSLHEEPLSFTGDVDLVSKQIKESNKKLMYDISVVYPQLTGGNNPNFEKFNQAAHASVTKKVAGFKKDIAAEGDEPRPEGSMGSDLSIGYTVSLAQDDLVSIAMDVSSYYQGAAHPNSYADVINFDLKNGKQLKLSDLFKPGAKFLQPLASYCIAELKKQLKAADGTVDNDWIEKGAAPAATNYTGWTITRRGLSITFDPYQVGPYALGPQVVVVPYSNLKDLINPDGPVAQFAK